ncbi:MAG: SDR family NAD(P)-dependent oxidoreductase [Anaerolineales bacterium]|nr:SDR family NAD(P)-dependent oxidoreductase [Anaerolineales bacterium]
MAHRLRATSDAPRIIAGEPLAIIGVGCRFPGGANSPAAFWSLLRDGVDAITKVPDTRWDAQAWYDPDSLVTGKMSAQWGGFVDGVEGFDPGFFGIAPREAEQMDPQQRLLLEVAWEALEQAGQTREHLAGSPTGVFVGVSTNDYQHLLLSDRRAINAYAGSGTAHSIVANRLSYLLDLQGPSLAVDTACSSSLVAVHLACQSLRLGDCDMALAGGVNLILAPEPMLALSQAQMLAPDGRCKTFDARANGYARGEGCGVIVLKRLADALAANDNILAVILGSAVNQDGRSTGLTAPNGMAQQAVMRWALANAGVAAQQISYIETHGTGTSLGDPIEVEAIAAVYGDPAANEGVAPRSPIFLGAVKTNIGHLEAAAGIAGLIKVVLAIENGQIPANLHFDTLNPNINLAGTPFTIPTAPQRWQNGSQRRCAAISSFGFGGTNAHLILEAPPAVPDGDDASQPARPGQAALLPISAHTPEALRQMAARYRDYLNEQAPPLMAVCHTAARQRTHHRCRLAVTGETGEEIAAQLDAFVRGERRAAAAAGAGRLAWVFTGQGADACQLPDRFLDSEPVFGGALADCADALARHTGWSAVDFLLGRRPDLSWRDTSVAQPALFAVQVALAALWRSWGIEPEAVVGHSVGEIAAAHVAGILTLADAAWLVSERGRLMQPAHGLGRAASVQATPAEAAALAGRFPGRLAVAASNSPVSVILSGEPQVLDEIMAEWKTAGRLFRYLPVDYAFHSEQVRPFGDQLVRLAASLKPQAAQIPFHSTVTGRPCAGPQLDAAYWGRNLAGQVRFAEAMASVLEAGYDVFLEIGVHPLLLRPMRQCIAARTGAPDEVFDGFYNASGIALAASLRQGQDPSKSLRQSLAVLYSAGLQLNWRRVYGWRQRPVALPPYAWQRERFWAEPRHPQADQGEPRPALVTGRHPFVGVRHDSPLRPEIVFEARLAAASLPILLEHRLHGVAVVPAVVMLDMALSAAARAWAAQAPIALEAVLIQAPLVVDPEQERILQLILQPEGANSAGFRICSGAASGEAGADWIEHAHGRLHWKLYDWPGRDIDLAALRQSLPQEQAPDQLYAGFRERGLVHGEAYRHVVGLQTGEGEALGRIEVGRARPASEASAAAPGPYQLPPSLFESCLQVVAAPLFGQPGQTEHLYVPLAVDRLVFLRRPEAAVWCHARIGTSQPGLVDGQPPETYTADVDIVDDDGRPIACLQGLRLKRVARESIQRQALGVAEPIEGLYQLEWQKPAVEAAQPTRQDTGAWLLLADTQGIAGAIQAQREAQGLPCILVVAAEQYSRTASGVFLVDPHQPEHLDRLWKQAFGSAAAPCTTVLCLWSAIPIGGPGLPAALGVTLMAARNALAGTRLWFVTQGGQTALKAAPEQAADASGLLGLAHTFALEHSTLWGGTIRIDDGLPPDKAAEAIRRAVLSGDDEDQIDIRADGRYFARLRPLPRPTAAGPSFRPDRTYLVTGGLGALGQPTARWLVQHGARHVAVVSRRSADSPQAEALRGSLPEGVQARFFQADVGDRAALAAVMEAIQREGPALAGVFHLAGALDDGVLLRQSWQRFARVMGPKAAAAWHLHALTEALSLDVFVLFSSVSGLLGAAGQANYAAANACLDDLAHYRRRRGLPALSVNWSVWAETGMAARLAEGDQARLDAYGLRPISLELGLAALGQALAAGCPQAVVMPVDWRRFDQALPVWRKRSLLRERLPARAAVEAGAQAAQAERERLRRLPAPERLEALQRLIGSQVRGVLGLASSQRLDPKRGFFQLGMDSLMAVELQQRLQRALGLGLPATAVFDYPSLERLGAYLDGLLCPIEQEATDKREAADASLTAARLEVEALTDDELDTMLTNLERDQQA